MRALMIGFERDMSTDHFPPRSVFFSRCFSLEGTDRFNRSFNETEEGDAFGTI